MPEPIDASPWDVVIVGAGPTGLTLANHLGTLGVRTLVLERLPQLIDYPRGVGIDDEALRSLQTVGLAERVREHTVPGQIMRFVDRRGRVLAAIDPQAQPFGWPRRSGFIQPLIDQVLADGLARFEHVRLQHDAEVQSFSQDAHGVALQVGGTTLRARYLVGCDGGRSVVRQALNLSFDGQSESTKWLVIDIANDPVGTPNVRLVLDDESPYVELALPHGIRRYEFMVPAGADEALYETSEQIQRTLARVLPPSVQPDVIRHRVYTHHARIAPTFQSGRVFLAGDAAHLMPVWQGQGFNTGLRDATNLAWKLAMAVQQRAGAKLLDTYTQERRPHAAAMIDLSVLVGRIFAPTNPMLRTLRNLVGPWISRVGWLRRYISEMRFKPMPFFSAGIVVHPDRPSAQGVVGKMFVQPRVLCADGATRRLDDAIGLRFALVCWSVRVDAWLDDGSREIVQALDARQIVVRPACQSMEREPPAHGIVLGDADGDLKRWFDHAAGSVVILRPDRIVAAVCQPWQLAGTLQTLASHMDLRIGPAATEGPVP